MSWGAVTGALKQGMKNEMATGAMRDANDPTGQGFGGQRAPAPQAAKLPTLNDLPATPGYTASPAGVGPAQPLQIGPAQNQSPLQALLAQIWKRPQPTAR